MWDNDCNKKNREIPIEDLRSADRRSALRNKRNFVYITLNLIFRYYFTVVI